MKFSVLIPVYNTEKYLDECIQSVLSQTYQDFEIILVDDGSTDNSGAICNRYHTDYPKTIKVIHQNNQGQLASRCNAINNSVGEYCIFVDADDLLVNNALEVISKKISQYEDPDMLIYSFYYESEDGNCRKADKLFDEGLVSNGKIYQLFFTGTGLNNVWTKAVKREKALCVDFDFSQYSHLRCSEDKLHSMVMVDKCQTFAYVYEHLYRYRLFEGSVTRDFSVDSIEKFNSVELYEVEKSFIIKWGLPLTEWYQKLDAISARTAVYVFDLFYKITKGTERKKVLRYDWSAFLAPETLNGLQENPYLSDKDKMIWRWIVEKNFTSLKLFFFKKNICKKLKKLKMV